MKKILYLYREINPYNIPVFKQLVAQGFQLFVVHETNNKLIPFEVPDIENVMFFPKHLFNQTKLNEWALGVAPILIYVSDRTTVFGVSETMESCFFYEYATHLNVNMSNQYIFNQLANFRTYISLYNIPENAWNNVYISAYYINPQWYAFFRDCTFNITHPNYIGNPPNNANREHIFFDCNFIGKVWGQDYSTHRYYWSNPIGTQSARMVYMNSITAHIIDADGNAISNATVILKDKNGNTVLDTVSDIEGNTTKADIRVYSIEQDITTSAGYDEARQYRINYSPFTLTVSKEGYDDYVLVFTHNTKLDTIISLNAISYVEVPVEVEVEVPVYYHQNLEGTVEHAEIAAEIVTERLSVDVQDSMIYTSISASDEVSSIVSTSTITGT